ncbi:hypothetical protein niasHT_017712 [Heterodera trifolii]|uniref:Letm1 RBD domain-containing protein n=1 Tax=Heterodera trifolii TaxID=157864 RepID=A0ABD2L8B5_9BILA
MIAAFSSTRTAGCRIVKGIVCCSNFSSHSLCCPPLIRSPFDNPLRRFEPLPSNKSDNGTADNVEALSAEQSGTLAQGIGLKEFRVTTTVQALRATAYMPLVSGRRNAAVTIAYASTATEAASGSGGTAPPTTGDSGSSSGDQQHKQPLLIRVWNKLRDPKGLARLAWHALVHTWHGFRLFWLEARLSAKYLSKLARGQPLLRKERQQMKRTSLDVARLFPFSLFIIVPFMELLLPFYIKLFPRMMPSTFQDTSDSEQQYKRQLKAKNETAKFLQDSLEEIALARQKQGHAEGAQAIEFAQFLKKVRTGEGGYVNNEELFKFSKLFEDELTLDSLSMVHLRALCRLLGIAQFGTPEILRFRLRMKLRELKADDQLIEREGGVEVLSAQELQAACRARGMRALGLSEERLRQQLRQWVELSSDEQVPPSLLLLTRAMYFPEDVDFTARIRSIVGSLPKEIGDFKAITLKELEGVSDPQAKIELLRSIEADLKAERKLREERNEIKKKSKGK